MKRCNPGGKTDEDKENNPTGGNSGLKTKRVWVPPFRKDVGVLSKRSDVFTDARQAAPEPKTPSTPACLQHTSFAHPCTSTASTASTVSFTVDPISGTDYDSSPTRRSQEEQTPRIVINSDEESEGNPDDDLLPHQHLEVRHPNDSSESSLLGTSTSDSDDDDSNQDDIPGREEGITEAPEECAWVPISQNNALPFPHLQEGDKLTTVPPGTTPADLYRLLIDGDVVRLIVTETNRYARQCLASQTYKRKARAHEWVPTNEEEIYKYLSIIILMGINHQPSIAHYWRKGSDMFGVPLIASSMTRDRFQLLTTFMHFSNNEALLNPRADRLVKIRDLVTKLNQKFSSLVTPGRWLIIDESQILWRGRLAFRQYNKTKRHRYGVKLYKICTENSYTLRSEVYTGKGTVGEDRRGHGFSVAMKLMEDYTGEGRTLICDNFYTSIPLAEELLNKATTICGTVRPNRLGLPKELFSRKMKKGESAGLQCGHGTKVVRWVDKRSVTMITTIPECSELLVETGKTRHDGSTIWKPTAVLEYNSKKKGVDVADQMGSYNSTDRRGIKWYRKVAIEYLTGIAIVNAHTLHHLLPTVDKMSILHFREAIVRAILGETPPLPVRRLHSLQEREGRIRTHGRRCTICYKANTKSMKAREADTKTKKVRTYCADCPGSPTMCLPCFNRMHR